MKRQPETMYDILKRDPKILDKIRADIEKLIDENWEYNWFVAEMLNLQDALDEVPGADPYEKIEYIHKNEFDHIIIGYRNSLGWPCAISLRMEVEK